jgi:hypothetical protein
MRAVADLNPSGGFILSFLLRGRDVNSIFSRISLIALRVGHARG